MNDLRTAKTLIPRKQSCSKYAPVNGFICTDIRGLNRVEAEAFGKRLFFLFEMSMAATSKTTKVLSQRARGSRETLFSCLFLLFISFILLIEFNYVTYVS